MTLNAPTLIVATGSRRLGAANRTLVSDALTPHVQRGSRLFHGANGINVAAAVRYDPWPPQSADAIVDAIWRTWTRCPVRAAEPYPAQWHAPCDPRRCRADHRKVLRGRSMCPAAGPYRNQQMIDAAAAAAAAGWQVRVLAFPVGASHGTHDCMRRARAAGLDVITVSVPDPSVRWTRRPGRPAVPPGQ